MTDRMERRLPEILTAISAPQVPDYFDDILGLTVRRRQRPGWTFPGRWLPVDITVHPVPVARTPWRLIGSVVLLFLLLAAAVLVYLGANRTRLAPLFGPAANGSLIYERQGDIYVADPDLRGERVLIGGDSRDIGMRWSLDGGTVYFGRIIDGKLVAMSADPSGSNQRQLTTALVYDNGGVEVAPDGSRVVSINNETNPPTLEVAPLDGSNTKAVLDLGGVVPIASLQWRPPDADEIVFVGNAWGAITERGLYRIRPDGSGLTTVATSIVKSGTDTGAPTLIPFQDVVVSDDGRQAAYWNWEPEAVPGRTCHVHVIDLDSGVDRMMTYDPTADCEVQPLFLADGRIIFERGMPDGLTQLLTADVEGGEPTRVPDFEFLYSDGEWRLAPDRRTVLWTPFEPKAGPTQLVDIATGETRDGVVHLPEFASWQRLAP